MRDSTSHFLATGFFVFESSQIAADLSSEEATTERRRLDAMERGTRVKAIGDDRKPVNGEHE